MPPSPYFWVFFRFLCLLCSNAGTTVHKLLNRFLKLFNMQKMAAWIRQPFLLLSESWSKTKNSMVWYIRYEPLERISDITSRLEFLARYNDLPQLMAQANQLLTCVHELYDNELPLLRNLV